MSPGDALPEMLSQSLYVCGRVHSSIRLAARSLGGPAVPQINEIDRVRGAMNPNERKGGDDIGGTDPPSLITP